MAASTGDESTPSPSPASANAAATDAHRDGPRGRIVQTEWSAEGRVIRVRSLSKRLLFFDLLLSQPSTLPAPPPPCPEFLGSSEPPVPAVYSGDTGPPGGGVDPSAGRELGGFPERVLEVVLKWPTCGDVRAQGKAVRQGALVRAKGPCLEWQPRGASMDHPQHPSSTITRVSQAQAAMGAPGFKVQEAETGCWVALATRVSKLAHATADSDGHAEGHLRGAGEGELREVERPVVWNVLVPLGGRTWELMGRPGEGFPVPPTSTEADTFQERGILHQRGVEESSPPAVELPMSPDQEEGGRCSQSEICCTAAEGEGKGRGSSLPHVGASASEGRQLVSAADGVCKGWLNSGRCALHDKNMCPHQHPARETLGRMRAAWVQARLARRALLRSRDTRDPHGELDKAGGQARAVVFSRWLVDEFGRETLCQGKGVLDVAGGRGLLSFALCMLHGVPATVVDPRPVKLYRAEWKLLRHCGGQRGAHQSRESEQGRATAAAQFRDSFQVEGSDVEGATSERCSLSGQDGSLNGGKQEGGGAGVLHGAERLPGSFQEEFYGSSEEWRGRAKEFSCLVGLHPDEATADIVFAAVANRQPFAVVPCCVFPGRFRRREGVGDVEGLCEYLMDMCRGNGGEPHRAWLGFKGRNSVVFCKRYS